MTKGIVINQKGQLSIFLAISIVFFMTTVAFVINVGLFVKAKINLQNAVDAAAWSGAAVQARQLTDIGYLNWEMRNNYKEWLYKYYVLGNFSTKGVQNPLASGSQSNFRLGNQFERGGGGDKYNIPSICLASNLSTNVCNFYSLPGVPRLSNIGFTGLDQVTKQLEDSISIEIAKNCTRITNTNFVAAQQWTYGLGRSQTNSGDLPNELIVSRPGAWTKGIELAFRIRNIEAMINAAPNEATLDNIDSISQQGFAKNERIVKSFYSAFRNLGSDSAEELKSNLKITELRPTVLPDTGPASLSNLLILGGTEARNKYYIDLKFYPINMAIFFTTLSPKAGDNEQASCEVIKTAYPAPAFPLGFDKNQNVLTYYAVKGETRFNGLFNPFSKSDGIRLVAYAAAKPFGARIGPKIFNTYTNENFVTPRGLKNDATSSKRSSSYAFGLRPTPGGDSSVFPPILPDSADFWVQDPSQAIGGLTGTEDPKFVIPNLTYKISGNPLDYSRSIYVMDTPIELSNTDYKVGLYDPKQLADFKGPIPNRPSVNDIVQAIQRVRSPTDYEAQNYLIPTTDSENSAFRGERVDHYGQSSAREHGLKVFAPILGKNSIYTPAQMRDIIAVFFEAQQKSIISFRDKMYEVRDKALASAQGDVQNYTTAMDLFISRPLSCSSVIGQLTNFLIGPSTSGVLAADPDCDSDKDGEHDTYIQELTKYFTARGDDPDFRNFYIETYPIDSAREMNLEAKFSAFFPGENSGGTGQAGVLRNPIRGNRHTRSLRNFYSTKLISVKHVSESDIFPFKYSEGKGGAQGQGETSGGLILNKLENTEQLDDLKKYQ